MIKIVNSNTFIWGYDTAKSSGKSFIIYFGVDEICKTEAEAQQAAELLKSFFDLKSFFEAKQEGKSVALVIDNATPGALDWQDGYSKGLNDGYKSGLEVGRSEGCQTEIPKMQQAQSQPSDYQLRLERYAVDIYSNNSNDYFTDGAVNMAAKIIALAAEKAREHGTKPD